MCVCCENNLQVAIGKKYNSIYKKYSQYVRESMVLRVIRSNKAKNCGESKKSYH